MKILLATPIYPPEIGGPSQYVKNLSEMLEKRGIKSEVISYNEMKNIPQPLRFLFYFLKLLNKTRNSDIVYAFNLISCGLPACFWSKVFKKRFIIRLGGDFLWERAVESGRMKKTLREYYQEPKTIKEKFWLYVIKRILNSADKIIFTSHFQKQIYLKHFSIEERKIVVVSNPFPETEPIHDQQPSVSYQFLYAGRLLKLKNLNVLIEVFKKILERTDKFLKLKIIGNGPEKQSLKKQVKDLGLKNNIIINDSLSHQEILKEIQKSYLCILPALTDITPKFVLECIKLKRPILLTQETEYYQTFKQDLIFFNPQDKKDIEEKILNLLSEKKYYDYVARIKRISTSYSWSDVVEKHISLFKEALI